MFGKKEQMPSIGGELKKLDEKEALDNEIKKLKEGLDDEIKKLEAQLIVHEERLKALDSQDKGPRTYTLEWIDRNPEAQAENESRANVFWRLDELKRKRATLE